MRLGIYVYKPTTVTFSTAVKLERMNPVTKPGELLQLSATLEAKEVHHLERGLYRNLKVEKVVISAGPECEIVILEDKDPYPDPKTRSTRLENEFSKFSDEVLANFLPIIAKGIEVSAVPNQAEANGHGGAERKGTGTTGY